MALSIRPALVEDAAALARLHARAVHGLAVGHYPSVVLRAWAPLDPDEDWIEGFRQSHASCTRIVAVSDGRLVGFAELAPESKELRACYVDPDAARQGIGRALVARIEALARDRGLASLWLDASLNAETFYHAQGYEIVERGTHMLERAAGSLAMPCVKMRKAL